MSMAQPNDDSRERMRQRPERAALGYQRWSDLLFLHWEVDAAQVQATLPDGLWVDTFLDKAYLGIVPFFMERIRPAYLPPLPWVSWFLELNVRTYVYDRKGRPGVWFYSLDCNQPIAVHLARRFFKLPYEHATMGADRNKQEIAYRCQRERHDNAWSYQWRIPQQTRHAQAGTLEFFLLERYALFASDGHDGLYEGLVHHSPYRFGETAVQHLATGPAGLAGFDLKGAPCSVLAAEAVDVEVFKLRAL
jgi:uncharacterized protein